MAFGSHLAGRSASGAPGQHRRVLELPLGATLKNMQTPHVSAYGAGTDTPQQAATVLRARAHARGVTLAPVSVVDQRIAALAAEALAVAAGSDVFDRPAGHSQQAAVAAVLARAAGQGEPVSDSHDGGLALGDELAQSLALAAMAMLPQASLARIFRAALWSMEQGASPLEVIHAARDLAVGSQDSRIAGACDALLSLAIPD